MSSSSSSFGKVARANKVLSSCASAQLLRSPRHHHQVFPPVGILCCSVPAVVRHLISFIPVPFHWRSTLHTVQADIYTLYSARTQERRWGTLPRCWCSFEDREEDRVLEGPLGGERWQMRRRYSTKNKQLIKNLHVPFSRHSHGISFLFRIYLFNIKLHFVCH